MQQDQNRHIAKLLTAIALLILTMISFDRASAFETTLASITPDRCTGYGNLESISLTDWEAGLGSWTVGTHDVSDSNTFDTPDWAVVGNLPDGRAGMASFVANLDIGDCGVDDETGALTLDSPPIVLPGDAPVPRISIDHWFQTEFGWDGGNFKISVNGGAFNLIPASAIEVGPYNDTLFPPLDQFGGVNNTNPLADQDAFTGTVEGQPTGSWIQSHINLLGIAAAGDTIKLRFDFGVDGCGGDIGWYVDEVEIYSCEAELPPSDCGNGVIDQGEQCDDGNNFIDDGCSNICQIEDGWQCTAPTPPGNIADPGFEAGTPNPSWIEVSNNPIGTPICEVAVCNTGGGTGPSEGTFWAWFGGIKPSQEGSVSQSVVIPSTVTDLTFDLEIPACDSASDFVEVLIDGTQKLLIDGSSPLCGIDGYATQSVDISTHADGGAHNLEFHSETFSDNGGVSNFFIDVIAMPGSASFCRREGTNLTLVKEIINDDGGSESASAWTLTATGPTPFSGPGPIVSSPAIFDAGSYDLAESGGPDGYSDTGWACDGGSLDGATITLAPDEAVTCTITNDDIAPTLTVAKTIVNDNGGGIIDPDAFGLRVDGLTVLHNAASTVDVGDHTVSEDGLPGYVPGTWGGDCNPDGTITLALGETATCTITNNDITPTLTVVKTIVNDNGGTIIDENAFGLKVDGGAVLHNVSNTFDAGAHTVSEDGLPGYVPGGWGGDCNPDGSITLALGEAATCTIINDDDGPGLTLVKQVTNNSGGVAVPADWTLSATGPIPFSGPGPSVSSPANFEAGSYDLAESGGPDGYSDTGWACDGGSLDGATITLALGESATCTITNDDIAPALTVVKTIVNDNGGTATDENAFGLKVDGGVVLHNVSNTFDAGVHTVSENGLPGYVPGSWGGDCNADGTITLALGEAATCTITNNDITPTLTVVKTIVNNNGGTVTDENAFGLKVDGGVVLHGASNNFDAGAHTVSEDGLPGYVPGSWGGDCNPDGSITLVLGESAICTITNDDMPTLTVVKTIVNDNGGTVTDENAFGLKVDGGVVLHGVSNNFDAGAHTVSEDGLPGYVAGTWGGDCNGDGFIMLALDQNAICTITNSDMPTLMVVKTIVNDNGGTITEPDAFGLQVDGAAVLHNAVNLLDAGIHTVSENGLPGYQAGTWGGDCNPDGSITLAPDQNATCTITNNDGLPTLTLVKAVITNNGGVAVPADWTLSATGPTPFSGPGPSVSSPANFEAGSYDLAESGGPDGYSDTGWACDGGSLDGATITLALGETATCTIINDDLTPTLRLVKTIVNDDGGTVTVPNAFGLKVNGFTVNHNTANAVPAGNHLVSEDGLPGYVPSSWGGDCNSDGSITLTLDQDAVCTITNDDIAPTLTVVKTIVNDNGGTVIDENAFGLKVDGGVVQHNVSNTFDAGAHTVSEDSLPGYVAGTWGGDCNSDGSITLVLGESATCTITNDDSDATSLTVVKTIVNNNGGTVIDENAFGLKVDGGVVLHGVSNNFDAGVHTVSEDGLPGYVPGTWGGDCNPDGSITLVLGESATCTITNDDSDATSLTVVKTIVNNNGGTVTDENAFGLKVDGGVVLHGVSNNFDAGVHTVSEDGLPGYVPGTWGGDCNPDGSITLVLGEAATCTITNDDSDATSLTVVKTIVNNNGGTVTDENAFGLKVDGGVVLHGVSNNFDAGVHTVSEDGLPGYVPGTWGGDCNPDGSITLVLGESATCTITNDDSDATSLTVVKTIVNDNGGTIINENAFGLKVDGAAVLHGVSNPFDAGVHTVSEDGLPGYVPGTWGGDCNSDGSITLVLGEAATCTITNDDSDATSLTVVKTIVNNNGGTITDENAFGLQVDGGAVLHNVSNTFDAGAHTVSEDGLPGYMPGTWGGDCNPDGSITLVLGEAATCTIINDDDGPGLTLVKQVTNNNGGVAVPADWTLSATGPTPFSGPGPTVASPADFEAGSYDLAESGGPNGYSDTGWACDGGSLDGATITLALGEAATCTITNDDSDATSLTVVKTIVNDNGGTVTDENAFGLKVDGGAVLHNVSNTFDAGAHTVSEDGLPGYVPSGWGGDCNSDGSITLVLGEAATCTITNDDSDATSLTVVKTIVNDNGGTVTDENAFGLKVDGAAVLHGVSNNFDAGVHTVSEDGLPGYVPGTWGGDCNPDGSITLVLGESATCTITNDDSDATSLTVVKTIVNDNGGTIINENAFGLKVDGGVVLHNVSNTFDAGVHTVSEDGLPGYVPGTWGGDCNPDGSITLVLGEAATCTITNDDSDATSLTVVKTIVNDNGGTVTDENAFGLQVDGGAVLHNVSNTFDAGAHTVSEDGLPGYVAGTWGGDCNPDGSITLVLGEAATCTITNDDSDATSLTVVKTIVNNNGGTITDENAFGLQVDGGAVLHNVSNTFDAGAHTVSEDGLPGYVAGTWGGDCNPDGSITLVLGEAATCTIINDDDGPGLTLVKQVTNNNGGVAVPADWTLSATGPTPFSGPGPTVASPADFEAGSYDLAESGDPDGYSDTGWACDGGNLDGATITLALGEATTCTIINDDDGPGLTLVKQVTNNNGGEAVPADWTLSATGPTPFSGPGPTVASPTDFEAGSYDLAESGGPDGYSDTGWACDGGSLDGATITLALGEAATCTIINDDDGPGLTLVKQVTNNNGGEAVPADWTLSATGPTPFSGPGPIVASPADFEAGSYDLAESGGPDGYSDTGWACDGGSLDGATITLALGEAATCTIINDDDGPGLTLAKQVTNNNGGVAVPADWTLSATGPTPFSGPGPTVASPTDFEAGSYDLAESGGPDGYSDTGWACDGGSLDGATITLALGEAATCTIINDDDGPGLTLVKQVTNNNGGVAVPADWTLSATGPTPFSGPGPTVASPADFEAGSYDLAESGDPDGYSDTGWACDGGSLDGATLTLALGEAATCTIINDDDGPGLTLVKQVTNNNGGVAVPADWTLSATGPTPFSGPGPTVASPADFEAGSYDLAESGGPDGYSDTGWACDGGSLDGATITLALGEAATCTIINDDDGPGLTLVKQVTNNNGGVAVPADWTLSVTGPTPFSGPGPTVASPADFEAGSYDLAESGGPDGYSDTGWACDGGSLDGATITLALGEAATCTIINDDDGDSEQVIFTNGFE